MFGAQIKRNENGINRYRQNCEYYGALQSDFEDQKHGRNIFVAEKVQEKQIEQEYLKEAVKFPCGRTAALVNQIQCRVERVLNLGEKIFLVTQAKTFTTIIKT